MPSLPRRPCAYPGGCPNLAGEGSNKCAAHRRALNAEQDGRRSNPTVRGYGAEHKRMRLLCFARDAWRCVDCGWEPAIVSDFRHFNLGLPPAFEVLAELKRAFRNGARHLHADHQIPIAENPELRLHLDNLKTRCNSCHNSKTMRETHAGRL